ncbi:hypothetical protein [Streptomyces sp. NPDC093097]|uniref:hypothetical protein n=1 Tax=Streptomyces sp. NPDC093097 TaxID=3366027 RepID=UPI0037F2CF16
MVRTEIGDLTVKGAWAGPARLQLFAHALAPLADLPSGLGALAVSGGARGAV